MRLSHFRSVPLGYGSHRILGNVQYPAVLHTAMKKIIKVRYPITFHDMIIYAYGFVGKAR